MDRTIEFCITMRSTDAYVVARALDETATRWRDGTERERNSALLLGSVAATIRRAVDR